MKRGSLTAHEKEILSLAALGYENKEIAKKLYISVHTVKAHLAVILKELNAVNRTHAVYRALQQKEISLNLERRDI